MRKSLAKPRRCDCDLVRAEAPGIYFARGKRNIPQQDHSGSIFDAQIEAPEVETAWEQLLQSRPAALRQRYSCGVAAVDLQTQSFSRESSNRPLAPVHHNGFETQTDCCPNCVHLDVKRRITRAGHVKSAQHHRTQEGRIYYVDFDRETLLPRSPPDPHAKAIRDSRWRKPDGK